MGSWTRRQETQLLKVPLSLTGCVVKDKSLHHSELYFLMHKTGIIFPAHEGIKRIKWLNMCGSTLHPAKQQISIQTGLCLFSEGWVDLSGATIAPWNQGMLDSTHFNSKGGGPKNPCNGREGNCLYKTTWEVLLAVPPIAWSGGGMGRGKGKRSMDDLLRLP